jgi:hypothetical protein
LLIVYPSDIMHDLLEGAVPFEIAYSLAAADHKAICECGAA